MSEASIVSCEDGLETCFKTTPLLSCEAHWKRGWDFIIPKSPEPQSESFGPLNSWFVWKARERILEILDGEYAKNRWIASEEMPPRNWMKGSNDKYSFAAYLKQVAWTLPSGGRGLNPMRGISNIRRFWSKGSKEDGAGRWVPPSVTSHRF